MEDGPAAEGEQLPSQGCRTLGGAVYLAQVFGHLAVGLGRSRGQLCEAVYRCQQIVEVVSDAAGEPADGLQLLGLSQLVFELVLMLRSTAT